MKALKNMKIRPFVFLPIMIFLLSFSLFGCNKNSNISGIFDEELPGVNTDWEEDSFEYNEALTGKNLSILGDSISTYQGISNDISNGLGQNQVFYSTQMSVKDTYWYQIMKRYGMNLCVNNSWSGAYASMHTPNVGSHIDSDGSVSSGIARANNLSRADGTTPDYIIVFIGINDLDANVSSDVVFDAYEQILDTIEGKYPNARVLCVNLPNRINCYSPVDINEGIKTAVEGHKNAYLVNLYDSEYSGLSFHYNSLNDNLHPNALGMDLLTDIIIEAMEKVALD